MFDVYRLPNKLPGEKIVKVLRRDLLILIKKIFFFLVLAAVFFAFFFSAVVIFPAIMETDFFPAIVLASSAYLLFIWLFFFFSFIDYYLDIWIITNERIINVEQQGFFSRIISEQRLFRVQDVTSEVVGFMPTFFKYGNVYVQTAAEKDRFAFEQVPDPNGVRDTIIKLAELERVKMNKELVAQEQGTK
jgi:signal transduction histidine kinase